MSEEEFKKIRVLIVDDQPEAREVLRGMLIGLGFVDIYEADNGKKAARYLSKEKEWVNLVICDWNMPDISGIDILKKLRETGKDIPFLMITGRGDLDSVKKAKDNGVNAYIRKPYSPLQLEAKIRIVMDRAQAA